MCLYIVELLTICNNNELCFFKLLLNVVTMLYWYDNIIIRTNWLTGRWFIRRWCMCLIVCTSFYARKFFYYPCKFDLFCWIIKLISSNHISVQNIFSANYSFVIGDWYSFLNELFTFISVIIEIIIIATLTIIIEITNIKILRITVIIESLFLDSIALYNALFASNYFFNPAT